MRIHRSAIVALMLMVLPACQSAQQNDSEGLHPRTTTVCSIARAPSKFNRAFVLVRAHIASDGFEHTDLVDHSCEKLGISLDYSTPFKGQDELVKAMHSPWPGTVDKDISGVFIGRVEWHAKVSLSLQLTGIRDLRVVKIDPNRR